jgi:hypothetical protein
MVPVAGALGAMFGVCCNEMAADGRVVDFFYGCGAHSDTPAPAGTGSPAHDPFDDGVIEVVPRPVPAETPEHSADEISDIATESGDATGDDATGDDVTGDDATGEQSPVEDAPAEA